MNMNYNYLTAVFRSILTQILCISGIIYILTLKSSQAKIVNRYFSTRKNVHLGENTSKYCSRVIIVSCSCNFFFLKFTQRVTILQTVSNQEVILKRLISMLRVAQKLYVGGVKLSM